ncbi:MAG: hypothetical protein NTW75_05575 [Planctomycetales bacterium]|nr:hypothetical protein [Planctomycetales bacterium]
MNRFVRCFPVVPEVYFIVGFVETRLDYADILRDLQQPDPTATKLNLRRHAALRPVAGNEIDFNRLRHPRYCRPQAKSLIKQLMNLDWHRDPRLEKRNQPTISPPSSRPKTTLPTPARRCGNGGRLSWLCAETAEATSVTEFRDDTQNLQRQT